MAIQIWAQSASDLSLHTRFAATIAEHGRRVCQPDTQIDVHGLLPGTYPPGMGSTEICCEYPATHHMLSLQIMENAIRAEREGYDAMVVRPSWITAASSPKVLSTSRSWGWAAPLCEWPVLRVVRLD